MTRTRIAWAVASIVSAFVVMVLVTAIIVSATQATAIRDAQVNNTKTIENSQETLDLIRDCTQPEGDCYKRGQESTAEVVDNIGLLATYAAACADQPETQSAVEIRECVLDLLDRPRPKR